MTTEPSCSLQSNITTRLLKSDIVQKPVNEFRVGDHVILGGVACRILELKRSKPGKHGSAKTLFIGRSLDTGKQVREIGIRNMTWLPRPKDLKDEKDDEEEKKDEEEDVDDDEKDEEEKKNKIIKYTVLFLDKKNNLISLIDDDDNIRDDISIPTDPKLRRDLICQWETCSMDRTDLTLQVQGSNIVSFGQ